MTHILHGLRGEVVVEASADATAARLAGDLVQAAHSRIEHAAAVHLALSGGSSPQHLYSLLASAPGYTAADWAHTHLWLVDERCVPEGDPRLNFAMIRAALIARVPVPPAQVHPMPVGLPDGASRYENDLRAALTDRGGRLDAVVLGMGTDGHTASLFPHSPALGERVRWVARNDGQHVLSPRPRMTLTYPTLNAARFLAVLVTGAAKHAALRAAAHAAADLHEHPIVGVAVAPDARMVWYLDRAAADGDAEPTAGG